MHQHRTRSMSASYASSPSHQQQFKESNVNTLSRLSPILSSPILPFTPKPVTTDEQSNTKLLQPSNLSTKMEDTIVRESSSSSSVDHSPPSSSFSFSQPIGYDTQRRIQVSNTMSSLQQGFSDLITKSDINIKISNERNDRYLQTFEYLSLQMTNNSKLIGQLILQVQQNEINNSHATASINTNPVNTTHVNLPTPQISNSSILNSSSKSSSQSLYLSIKDINSFLENSVQTTTTTQSLRNYTTSKGDTPARLLNTHEATCDVYNIAPELITQLFLAHIRKFNNDLYQTFLFDTDLPRSPGRSKSDNPTAVEFASWSWPHFRLSFTKVFEDQNLHLKIKNSLDTWCSNSFNCFDDARKAHLLIMKDILYSKDNLIREIPQTLPQICQTHVQYLRATIPQTLAAELTLHITTSQLYVTNAQKPANFLLMTYDNLIQVFSEYTIHKAKEDAYFAFFKPKTINNNNNNTNNNTKLPNQARVNIIQRTDARTDLICEHCSKTGHLVTSCLKKYPELIKNFTCKICKQMGHMPHNCPDKI